jgi:hypothetical protein
MYYTVDRTESPLPGKRVSLLRVVRLAWSTQRSPARQTPGRYGKAGGRRSWHDSLRARTTRPEPDWLNCPYVAPNM